MAVLAMMSTTKRRKRANPTDEQFGALRRAWDYFNDALFDGRLHPVLLNLSRRSKAMGFFAPNRWRRTTSGEVTHEVSINPTYLATYPEAEIYKTLVHEMAHAWQQQCGTPPRRAYHDREWGAKMEDVGLMPSSTGAPGGAKTGQHMSDYVIAGGRFERALATLPKECHLPWIAEEREATRPGGGGTGPTGDAGEDDPRRKYKFTCVSCGANAWGKPTLNLICGDCTQPLVRAR